MFFIYKKNKQKNSWFELMQTLRLMFICKLFRSRLQVGQFKSHGVSPGLVRVKPIAVIITRVQYLADTLLSKIRRGKRQ